MSFLCIASYAQNYYSQNITIADGLPNNAIRSLFEDSRGYVWIGTDAGVCRWDGETYTNYNTRDGLAGNKVWWIDEDDNGNLWFACYGAGISKFDGVKFISYSKKDGLIDNYVRVVKYSQIFDCILIGTNVSISVLKDTVFHNFSSDNGSLIKDVIITAILEDNKKAIFYDFSGCQYKLNKDSNESFSIKRDESSWFGDYGACSAAISSNGDTIIGWGREGIIIHNNEVTTKIESIGQVFGIAEDYKGNTWLASWNGGISPPGGLFLLNNNKVKSLNSSYNINSIVGWSMLFVNNQDLIFYGTLDNGIYKIPPPYFEYYPPGYFKESHLGVHDLEIDRSNEVWFITDSLVVSWDGEKYNSWGLDVFYKTRNNYEKNYKDVSSYESRISKLNDILKKNKTSFFNIEKNQDNEIWVSVRTLGLFSMPNTNSDDVIFRSNKVGGDFIFDEADTLYQSHIWLNSLTKYLDIKNPNLVKIYKDSTELIYAKKLARYKNEIWAFSRISGVFLEKDGEFRNITREDTTISKIVNDICFDDAGYAYLGGNDGKIEILAPVTRKKIDRIQHSDYDFSINWVEISKNRLFVGSSGILRVYNLEDIANGKYNHQLFTKNEGYNVKVVNNTAVDASGKILLATNSGIVKINTELLLETKYNPLKTVIQSVDIHNKSVNWSDYVVTNPWSGLPTEMPELTLDQNHLSFHYHTINYNNAAADSYYFKLKGVDEEWAGPTNKKDIVYTNLHPGNYTYVVKSRNELSGLYSSSAEFSFIILRPWYMQAWLYILIVILFILIFVVFYNYRIIQIKKREENKTAIMKKITKLEIKALQAQMNPHFLFNTISSIQNYVLDKDVDEALTYLNSFSKVIRMTLEYVDKQFISLSDELAYLDQYVTIENMRFDNLIEYKVKCSDDIDIENTLIPPMLLQPIIENSINHGLRNLMRKGHIKLDIIKLKNNCYKCIVEDNGVGRKRSLEIKESQTKSRESIGLKITEERLAILNKDKKGELGVKIFDLYSDKGEPAGTKVEITMPLVLN